VVMSEVRMDMPNGAFGSREIGARAMPDIASESGPTVGGTLDQVGMADIEVAANLGGGLTVPARARAGVSLDNAAAKGIHMSRLFLAVQEELDGTVLDLVCVERLLHRFLASHQGLSQSSSVRFDFDLLLQRPALISGNSAWRSYPVSLAGDLRAGEVSFTLGARVTYSSTCPCSAALARQLIQERFRERFEGQDLISAAEFEEWLGDEEAVCATPHSQRSHADVLATVLDAGDAPTLEALIDEVEGALKTPVQAAVKREDEREFARLNGENLMFCEDAGRRLKHVLDSDERIADYHVTASHFESLHAHDAVCVVTKGVPGGFRA